MHVILECMAGYQLFKHKGYERSVRNLPTTIRQKALWSQVLLGIRGRTPSVKSTIGFDIRWRRTPVQGNHFYLWWIPYSESRLSTEREQNRSILIHSIRHHDQNSAPILVGTLDDYDELPVADLDPRFDEQWQIVELLAGGPDQPAIRLSDNTDKHPFTRPVAISTVKGLPGSGKTVSLYYLVRDLIQQIRVDNPTAGSANVDSDILYVTYTSRLKRAAQEFLHAQDAEIARRVRVQTLNELQSEITGVSSYIEPFSALTDFYQFLNVQNSSTLGPWKRYPQTLYTEVRAHLLGKNFPEKYPFSGGTNRTPEKLLPDYAKSRKIEEEAADIAFKISERAASTRFFVEQSSAQNALRLIAAGAKHPSWLKNLNALIVDEVQDLTLIQLAFLGELARAALKSSTPTTNKHHATPFFFTVAGDESQIVQPTGFDWGITKDLLSEQLNTYPVEYEFQHQRRAPRLLAQIIDNSWRFYRHLPKTHRPSARSDSFVDASIATEYQYESAGQVLLCFAPKWQPPISIDAARTTTRNATIEMGTERGDVRFQGQGTLLAQFQPGSGPDWQALVDELTEKPGRVLIDMTETLRNSLPQHVRTIADDVLFLSREIKGLERATVIIYGLNAAYERAVQLSENRDEDNIPRYEARRIFDEMRVALSRSTARLVLLEPADAPVLAELGIDPAANVRDQANSVGGGLLAVGWDDLLDTLRTEEMAELEVIEGYLDEVEDLAERGRWPQAYRRNRRAYAQALQLGDIALQRETQEQHITLHLQEAMLLFAQDDWSGAYKRNREAHKLAVEHGDSLLLERVNEQRNTINGQIRTEANALFSQALEWAKSHSYKIALKNAEDALKLASAIEEKVLCQSIEQTIARICRQWAYLLTDADATGASITDEVITEAIDLLERSATATSVHAPQLAKAIRGAASRYRIAPPTSKEQNSSSGPRLSATQTREVIEATRQYLTFVSAETADSFVALPVNEPAVEPTVEPTEETKEKGWHEPEHDEATRPTPKFIADFAAGLDSEAASKTEAASNAEAAEEVNGQINNGSTKPDISDEVRARQEHYLFPRRWIAEAFAHLGDHVSLYYLWAITAEQWMLETAALSLEYPEFDEQLWELENRTEMMMDQAVEQATDQTTDQRTSQDTPRVDKQLNDALARFEAFILGYHGDSAQASVVWEELGEVELAAEQARNAGMIERAYDLLRRSKAHLPEALTLAAKSMRQLEQLAQNPTTLRPEERRVLSNRLDEIRDALSGEFVE